MYSDRIRTFIQVAEMGSFSRVAAERSMSPASIMKQMNVLEQRTGVTLLRRTTHGIELTEAGQYLYSRAKELIAEADAAVGLARQIDGRNTRTIRIGSSLLRPGIVLTELWDQLCPDGGGYRFRLVPWDDDRDRVLSVIASLGRQTDFLVGAFLSRQMLRLARFCPLGTYNLCVAVPRSHRLAGRDKLTLEDLHGERLYMVKGGDIPQLCRLRDLRNAHDAQAMVSRINRCIEDSVESYDLSLTGLARMIGFNPSYLSRFYRIHTGRKLSEQIDAAKLNHAKALLSTGELIKNVAERTGFASPSAFILFFKRNTGMTPGQFCEQAAGER